MMSNRVVLQRLRYKKCRSTYNFLVSLEGERLLCRKTLIWSSMAKRHPGEGFGGTAHAYTQEPDWISPHINSLRISPPLLRNAAGGSA
jgi:hypothetical protein